MGFTLSRSAMLELMADTVGVPHERRSAFLGRFQHLQRLKLIEGINPGRGKAAEYRAHQMVIILIAFQMLQLGLTPERTVDVIRANEDHIRQAINIATATKEGDIAPSMIWFDPASLSTVDGFDPATATLGYAGAEQGFEALLTFFIVGQVDRAAFIGLSGSLWQLVRAIDGADLDAREKKVGEKGREFLASLRAWCENPEQELPDGLDS